MDPTSFDAALPKALDPSAKPDARRKSDAELRKAAEEFEAYFVQTIMTQMRKAIPQTDALHSRGEDMFRDMMDEQVGKDIAKGHGFGLADSLYRQLSLEEGLRGQ